MDKISIADFKKLSKKRNKYHAIKTIYNDRLFASKKEAAYAKRLEYLKHAHELCDRVVRIEYQIPFPIHIKQKHVFTYLCDFKVYYGDGREEIVDVKGSKTGAAYALFRLKKKCVEAQYGIEVREV